ncbi:unnamed protein product [Somion occarium]|uniref:AAA+ ATPase domain-containing protein n=1 Tax=Somion occarium TaxID=3059160 RepID=A0ABP1DQZ0_9APHY
MRRYLSVHSSRRLSTAFSEKSIPEEHPGADNASQADVASVATQDLGSTTALMSPLAPLVPPTLKIKRVDHYWSNWSKAWKYKNSGAKVIAEGGPVIGSTGNIKDDPWGQYCFVVVRKLPKDAEEGEPTFQVVVKSPYLIQACKRVIKDVPGISWNAVPLELFIAFLPQFEKYQAELQRKHNRSAEESHIASSIGVLVTYIRSDYRTTLASIANLTSHGEITFNLLYAIMVPRTILITECPITKEPRALQLTSSTKVCTLTGGLLDLLCESIDLFDSEVPVDPWGTGSSAEAEAHKAGAGKAFGRVQHRVIIPSFKGTRKIASLDAYPIKYHHNTEELKLSLIARGKKWVGLRGIHHMQYKGSASNTMMTPSGGKKVVRYSINSRIMVDRTNFRRLNPNYDMPAIKGTNPMTLPPPPPLPFYQPPEASHDNVGGLPPPPNPDPNRGIPTLKVQGSSEEAVEATEEELLLASPVVYGFSLSDKIWLEFNVELVQPIQWNDEAFASLVLPPGRKHLLQSLVEAHNSDLGFDDFVQGKGHGLVINLYGPPGVGKTLSAEATSEHVRKPLYVIGGGDLGTDAMGLDQALQDAFDIATDWKAIVLIDEADVFLEKRSLHELERNAMVAVFLRHVEYYRGILFMTTNRVKAFDEAFLSRIHVALHFQELTKQAKMQVWRAFLAKVGVEVTSSGEGGPPGTITEELVGKLSERDINGRQIKNATRTATSLARSRREPLLFTHLVETLDAMDEFTAEFKAMTIQGV